MDDADVFWGIVPHKSWFENLLCKLCNECQDIRLEAAVVAAN